MTPILDPDTRKPYVEKQHNKILTEKQQEILDYLIAYKIEHDGVPPSVAEIVEHFNYNTTSAAIFHLRNIANLGYISMTPREARSIQILGGEWTYKKPNK